MAVKYTKEQLNTIDKSLLISMLLNMQEQNEVLTKEVHDLNDKMQRILEQIALANDHRFGRSSEKMSIADQLCFMEVDGKIVFFNEAEAVSDLEDSSTQEETSVKKKKQAGKKEHDMSGLPITTIPHYMSEEELIDEFGPNGWKQLPDSIARRYIYIPAKIGVEEHHIGVYASKSDGHMVKAKHPRGLSWSHV